MDDLGRRLHLRGSAPPLLPGRRAGRGTTQKWNSAPTSMTSSGGWTAEVPEAVLVGVEQRDPVRLDERPDEAGERGQRAQRRDRRVPPRVPVPWPVHLDGRAQRPSLISRGDCTGRRRAQRPEGVGACLAGQGSAGRTTFRRRRGQPPRSSAIAPPPICWSVSGDRPQRPGAPERSSRRSGVG